MSNPNRIVILGGHGKVALRAAPQLKTAGYAVDSVIRNPDHNSDIEAAAARAVVLDLESATQQALVDVFAGAAAVVFAAGAGGGNPARTHAVDYAAATRAMAAAEQAGVKRFVMVSYARAATDVDRIDPNDAFYPYAKAKHDADAHLRQTALDYTILGPGRLTLGPASEKIQVVEELKEDWPEDRRVTSRGNVAAVITHVIAKHAAVRETVNFYDGDTPIAEAVADHCA